MDIDGLTIPLTARTISVSDVGASDGLGVDSTAVSSIVSGATSGGASIPTSSDGTPPSLVNGIRGVDPLKRVYVPKTNKTKTCTAAARIRQMAKIVRCFPKKMYSPELAFFVGFSADFSGGASTGIPYHKSLRPSLNTSFNTFELSKTILPDCCQTIPESGSMVLFLQDPVV
jgi:hypothetical protein